MKLTEKRDTVLKRGELCDHCLGRLTSLSFKGKPIEKVGAALRVITDDSEMEKKLSEDLPILEKKCFICGGLFAKSAKHVDEIVKRMDEQEMSTFLIGCRLQEGVQDAEEYLWTLVGTDNSEPIKRELNRTFGKAVEQKSGKKVDFENPDVIFTIDYEEDRVDKQIAPIYIYGRYKKLVRGIPQTKWPCRECGGKGCKHCDGKGKMYPESVEEIVAVELLKHYKSTYTKFHGKGREDIDALMLGDGRPFVIEIEAPLVRTGDLSDLERKVNSSTGGKVEVNSFRLSTKQEVIDIKAADDDKSYECIVKCDGITEGDLEKLREAFSKPVKLKQRTPTRVAHRRADLVRDKVIKDLKAEMISEGLFKVNITASSGTYIKELISGDSTRTKPSFTELLGKACLCESLNVTEVFGK